MYILPAGAPAVRNKWGLGMALRPGLDVPGTRSRGGLGWPAPSRRRFIGRLGDDVTDTYIDYSNTLTPPTDGSAAPPLLLLPSSAYPTAAELTTTSSPLPSTLISPGSQLSNQQAYQNLLTTQQVDQNALDYVSPQAAIAAGLPSQAVYSAWSSQLAKFPTTAAALAAGIPAGVVTQLWAQSRSAAPASSSLLGSNSTLLLGAAAVLGVALLAGRR